MKYTIEKLQEIVKNRGGQCLSKKIMDYHDKLQWQCKNHHIWSASLASIVYTKSWCPWQSHRHELKRQTDLSR